MTILFAGDWAKYPRATIHYNTKNVSYIKLAEIYNKMGVKNSAFHLSILQPELMDVDPLDPNLSADMKRKILYECKNNFWYFIREILKVPVPGSLVASNFEANRANIAMYWLFLNHVMSIIVIIRQTGKTTLLMALVVWLLDIGSSNTMINLLTKNETLKADTLGKAKALFEELPDYLNFSTKKDIFNSDEIKIAALSNKFKGNLSSASEKQAEKVGRGFTSPINLIDEAAFVENVATAMGAMLMSGNAARTVAAANNKPYGTILATTAGDTGDRDGGYIYRLVTNSCVWDERFLDCENLEELNKLIMVNSCAPTKEERRPIVSISMTHRQLGYDDEWLKQKLEENISTPENIKRDLFNKWLNGSASSPIPPKYLELMNDTKDPSPHTEFYAPFNYLIRWYRLLDEIDYLASLGHTFIAGIDTSDGVGKDDITFIVRDSCTGHILCTAVFNELNLITLAEFFVSFLLKYRNTVAIIERRSSAPTIIDYMILKLSAAGVNPFLRMYNTIIQNKDANPEAFEEVTRARPGDIHIFEKHRKTIGFATSGTGITSRNELYSTTLLNMLKYTADSLFDEKLIGQISSLIIKNNRVDHPAGGNDDMVIASLLSYWLITNGRNLSYYGIETATLMKKNKNYLNEKFKSDSKDYSDDEVAEMSVTLERLIEEYKGERNQVLAMMLEIKIKKLVGEMGRGGNVITVEDMFDELKREKQFKSLR